MRYERVTDVLDPRIEFRGDVNGDVMIKPGMGCENAEPCGTISYAKPKKIWPIITVALYTSPTRASLTLVTQI